MPRPGFVLDVDRSTPPMLFWRGEGFSLEKLPADRSRVIYPPEPLHGIDDLDGAIRNALLDPIDMEPLPALLQPDMKLTIVFDDASLSLPKMRRPDNRQRVGGLDGEIERARPRTVRERLGAICVGALELGLAMPQPGQIERHVGRHPEQHDAAPRPGDAQALGDRSRVANGIGRGMGTAREMVADDVTADHPPHGAPQLGRRDDDVGAE